MLFTPTQRESFQKQDLHVYKISRFSIPRLSMQPTSTARSTRAVSDSQMDIQQQQEYLLRLRKPNQIQQETYRQLTKTRCEMRQVSRKRDESLWSQSNLNQKVLLSKLSSGKTSRATSPPGEILTDRLTMVQLHARKNAFFKRNPVILPKKEEKKITVKRIIRMRERSGGGKDHYTQEQSELFGTPVKIERPNVVKLKIHKPVVGKKQDEFQEMMDLFQNRKMRALVQDVSSKHQTVNINELKAELKRTLRYIGRLGLTIGEAFSIQVFSQKPFQKQGSYEFIQAAKYGNMYDLKDLYISNKYLVYDFDYIYMTALHWACKRGHLEIVRYLIKGGADIEFQDIIGRPSLYFAIIGGNVEIVCLLLDHKANPWSTSAVNYNQICEEYNNNEALLEIRRARKQYITMKMTPPRLRDSIWKNMRN